MLDLGCIRTSGLQTGFEVGEYLVGSRGTSMLPVGFKGMSVSGAGFKGLYFMVYMGFFTVLLVQVIIIQITTNMTVVKDCRRLVSRLNTENPNVLGNPPPTS